jgi:hypothetical protein
VAVIGTIRRRVHGVRGFACRPFRGLAAPRAGGAAAVAGCAAVVWATDDKSMFVSRF